MRLVTTDIRHRSWQAPSAPSSCEGQNLATSRRHAPLRQRGATLIESSIAVGLVGIAVFASVSSFGGDISSRISRGILPSIGGGAAPGSNDGSPASNETSPKSSLISQTDADYDPGDGVGGIVGDGDGVEDTTGIGGIDAHPPEDESDTGSSSSSQTDEYTFVGGINAYPEDGAAETGPGSSSMSTGDSYDSYVGGTAGMPPVLDEANESSASSTL